MKEVGMGSGDQFLLALSALANPLRLRIIAKLSRDGRDYVSQLARDLGVSRPLLHLHLEKLESAGLVTTTMEVSPEGKAMKYIDVAPFSWTVTPSSVAEAAQTLSAGGPPAENSETRKQN